MHLPPPRRLAHGGLAAAVVFTTLSCSSSDEQPASPDAPAVVRLATTSTADAYIPQYRAAQLFGEKFGLDTGEHVQQFESHATASQVMISGGADVLAGTVDQAIQLINGGVDVKMFCPVQSDSTEQFVGRTEKITDIHDVGNPGIRVAIDSPGGLVNYVMNQVFTDLDLGIKVDDLENVSVLEDGGLRLTALASGDVDFGSVDLFELDELREQLPDGAVSVLSVVAKDSDFLANVLFAQTDWLDKNPDAAGEYCATMLYSNRVLASNFDQYMAALKEYGAESIDEDTARTNWDFVREYTIWPYNPDALSQALVDKQVKVLIESGLLDEAASQLTYDQLVDTKPMGIATELLGGDVTPDDVRSGHI